MTLSVLFKGNFQWYAPVASQYLKNTASVTY